MKKQLGQSMTEYMVALGVTGAALLAATTDVTTLLGNMQNNYRTQSSEMNKVQIYNNPKIQTNPVTRDETDGDDGDETTGTPVDIPAMEYPPVMISVLDSSGNYLGTLDQNDMLIDEHGNQIAWCQRQASGQCMFVDADGNEVFPGAIVDAEWVDDDGNPLVLQALFKGDDVVGFAYLYNNNFYDAKSRKRLNPQPTNLTAVATRRVISYDNDNKPFFSGYEANGLIYSESSAQSGDTQDFSTAKKIEGELVAITYENEQLPVSDPRKYKPCVVTKHNWSLNMPAFGLDLAGDQLFTNPSSYLNVSAADCGSRHAVMLSADGKWTQTK